MTMEAPDYALLAKDAYLHREPYSSVTLGGQRYKIVAHGSNAVTGFQATAYERQDGAEIVIAYRGTEVPGDPLRDGAADASMVFLGLNPQQADAQRFTEKVMDLRASSERARPSAVSGHSPRGTAEQATRQQS